MTPRKRPPNLQTPRCRIEYTGTWEVYTPPSADPRVGKLLAKHVLNAAVKPLVYITNGEVESSKIGQSITWLATVVSGTPDYSYEWSIKKQGAADWSAAGDGSPSWAWTPAEAVGARWNLLLYDRGRSSRRSYLGRFYRHGALMPAGF